MALDGLNKRYGDTKRKKPVSISMLKVIRAHLKPEQCREGALYWAAILLGFFFLRRENPEAVESAH